MIEETQNNHKIHRTFDDVNNIMTRHLYRTGRKHLSVRPTDTTTWASWVELTLPNGIVRRKTHKQRQRIKDREKEKKAIPHHFIPYASFYDNEGNEISRLSNLGFILNQQFNEMNLPIRQRAGHEPRTHFNTTELRLTGIDSPSFPN